MDRGELRFRALAFGAAVLAVAWCCAFIGWQLIGGGDEAQIVLVGDLAPMLPMAFAGALALRAGRLDPDRRTANAYRLMALAFSAYLGATVLWAWFELVLHIAPWPSLADAGFLAFFPLLLAGLLRLPGPRRDAGERVRLALDISVVVLASAMAIWYFVVGPTVRGADQRRFPRSCPWPTPWVTWSSCSAWPRSCSGARPRRGSSCRCCSQDAAPLSSATSASPA